MKTPESATWSASGFMFENCSCQLVCPGHIHFEQRCTYERCKGYWAFRFDTGTVEGADLAGRLAVIAFDCPQRMVDGGWTQVLILDHGTSPHAQRALERLFSGAIGGPWQVLSRFVETRLPTRVVPITLETSEMRQRVVVEGVLDSTVTAIRGRDRQSPVRFENIYNQIHSSSQVIARGDASYDDGHLRFTQSGTHGLWSAFSWVVSN